MAVGLEFSSVAEGIRLSKCLFKALGRSYPRFQKRNSDNRPYAKCGTWRNPIRRPSQSFSGLREAGFKHVPRNQPLRIDVRDGAKSAVPLADRAIRNLQQ